MGNRRVTRHPGTSMLTSWRSAIGRSRPYQRNAVAERTRWLPVIVLLGIAIYGLGTQAIAAPSGTTMDFQGYLVNTSGQAIDDQATGKDMTFSIWTLSSSGTKIWEELHDGTGGTTKVKFYNGFFQVTLGLRNPLNKGTESGYTDDPVFTGAERWLEIKVDSETFTSARIQLTASPQALGVTGTIRISASETHGIGTTDRLSTFTVRQAADETNIGGTTVSDGSVTTITGSGTAFTAELGVGDRLSLSGASSTYATVTSITSDTVLTVESALSDGAGQTLNVKHSTLRLDNSSGTTQFIVQDNGNVGIGALPGYAFDVKGPDVDNAILARFYSATSARGSFGIKNGVATNPTTFIGTLGGSEQLAIGTENTEVIRIDEDQRVGIGTTTPGDKVDVEGNVRISGSGGYGVALWRSGSHVGALDTMNNRTTLKGHNSNGVDILNRFDVGIRLNDDRNVGIGTTVPSARLHVQDDDYGNDGGYAAVIENTGTGSDDHGLKIVLAGDITGNGREFLSCFDTDSTGSGYTEIGSIEASGNNSLQFTTGDSSDFAEYFLKLDPTEDLLPEQIVYLVGNAVTGDSASDWHTVGVISDRAAFVAGKPFGSITQAELLVVRQSVESDYDTEHPDSELDSDSPGGGDRASRARQRADATQSEIAKRCETLIRERTRENLTRHALVALIGRVPVRIKGRAEVGDYVLADGTCVPRSELTWEQSLTCVGKALESGEGQVLCLVGVR